MKSSMNKALGRAVKANEQGSALLELGETSKALRCFRSALNLLNEGCKSSEILPSACLVSSDSSIMSFDNALLSRPIRLGYDAQAAFLPISPENPTILYSQAFSFECPHKANMTLERHSFCSAVLIFNTALALHQKGSKEDGHKAYLKALLFYEESLSMLQPVADEPETVRVIQEIMKNRADIYCKLNDTQSTKVWDELADLTKDKHLAGMHSKSTTVSA
jgi:tetratricopeptide (TPR) repeat protein